MQTICSFDLGIKNLSFCVVDFSEDGNLAKIHKWTNVNLLADGKESQTQTRCGFTGCKSPASWILPNKSLLCKRCVTRGHAESLPVFLLNEKNKEKLTVSVMKSWLIENNVVDVSTVKLMKKTELLDLLQASCVMPYKAPKSKGVSLQEILAGMDVALDDQLPIISIADRIRIENQPSEFAPHMKSVQMMLFALLTHRLKREYKWTGTIEFANAAVKTRGSGIAAGKATKKDRKAAAIQKVETILTEGGPLFVSHLSEWKSQAKMDDMADSFLMCVDATIKKKTPIA